MDKQPAPTLSDLTWYMYIGGGYYRDTRVPKGETAPVVHGQEVIALIKAHFNPCKDNQG